MSELEDKIADVRSWSEEATCIEDQERLKQFKAERDESMKGRDEIQERLKTRREKIKLRAKWLLQSRPLLMLRW